MRAEVVLDASVAVKCVLVEDRTEVAKAYVASASRVIAPDLIFLELANALTKSIRRQGADLISGKLALADARALIDQTFPTPPLAESALALAVELGLSAYDAAYLALARERRGRVITADVKFASRLHGTPLAGLVTVL